MTSATLEEYLETIYKLAERGPVRPGQIAEFMGVSAPTVTATLGRLQTRDLISRTDDGAVELTASGRRGALDIIRRHRLAERFLVDVLGLSWDEVHDEACELEHALSPKVQDALERFMDNPDVCPHGHPIPSADGAIRAQTGGPLCDTGSGEEVRIVRIEDEDGELLSYLSSLGMFPGTDVRVCDVAPFRGPLMVEVGDARYALGREVAEKIVVTGGKGRRKGRRREGRR
ncbi:metal-dependent transcriptional regulator [Anaerosoma tenue]|uniref:metal-dependent transcriptional regulator n=1 Tax=Anaerosoma tenue TaxID=2933588 RepID=UPI002260D236|nr:metal-dependent transcriptional regulator [Anaerosoma tenue]MCK8114142.1 metal-dependent transcriptional regulator [Anaerosoma tenue]